MIGAFYGKFERHAHGAGIKGQSTHYCSGCGHGLAHKYLAEAISELGIQDRTVAVSPVGCSVFLYYYLDVGNTQAAHGRAPAVGLGHKLANPESIVVTYQGDGDLASIGLAEIVSSAQAGIPMSVIFINNAIYGMTGGQMAPTTLMGMKTSTSPHGRARMTGQPMKMAELMALLDGAIYVERVALFNAKERLRAKNAVKKALQLQVENKGFAFVEVLAECPTHLKMSPSENSKWVQQNMLPIFPLGVKKDVQPAEAFQPFTPSFDKDKVVGIVTEGLTGKAPTFCRKFPDHLAPKDVALKLAGAGGDGAQTAALLITRAGINEGFDATHIPSYGPESRGGTSYADVHIADGEVLSPASPSPHVLVAFNQPSLEKFGPQVQPGGTIIYDSSVVAGRPAFEGKKVYGVPFSQIAKDLGKLVVKNIVALGALQAVTEILPKESFLTAVRMELKHKAALIPLNEKAFELGQQAVK
ncbi:MAG: 2-oxoacid:acceptor oxidoreductase family protein [Elusimicrobia bacterium]|nr:2-oxoacid:acceptor oxidoreductase family protein [Elusimicrobiota bacterium]